MSFLWKMDVFWCAAWRLEAWILYGFRSFKGVTPQCVPRRVSAISGASQGPNWWTLQRFWLRSFNRRRNGFLVLLEGTKCPFSHWGTLISQSKLDFQPKTRLGEYAMIGLVFVPSTSILWNELPFVCLWGFQFCTKIWHFERKCQAGWASAIWVTP